MILKPVGILHVAIDALCINTCITNYVHSYEHTHTHTHCNKWYELFSMLA